MTVDNDGYVIVMRVGEIVEEEDGLNEVSRGRRREMVEEGRGMHSSCTQKA